MCPLVSICIGAYNRKSYIRECVDSALAQTWPHKEVVVVDDASTDGTREILQSYGASIRLILRDSNSGICPITRNQAVAAATGEYVAFLDSDDVWYPEKLAKQMAFMAAHPDVPMCHTLCDVIDERSRPVGVRHGAGAVPATGWIFEQLLDHCWITISTVLMRRSLYAECGPFSEILPYGRSGEDWEFFLKAARRHEIGFVPDVLARYRKAGEGISGGDWRGVPEAFPFLLCLRRRRDIWGGLVPAARVDAVVRQAALASSQYWRDRGRAGRAAYFPARWLLRRPLCGLAWAELAKSAYRAAVPRPKDSAR